MIEEGNGINDSQIDDKLTRQLILLEFQSHNYQDQYVQDKFTISLKINGQGLR